MKSLLRKNPLTRAIFFIVIDALLIAASFEIAFLVRFDLSIPPHYVPIVVRIIILAIIFIIPIFYSQKLYSFSWAYVSIHEVVALFKGTTLAFLLLGITLYISKYFPYFDFPRSIIFISYFLVFTLCGGLRFAKKIYFYIHGIDGSFGKDRTLIVGAGSAGEQMLRNIMSSKQANYFQVGFIDENDSMRGISIHGYKVLGKISDIPFLVKTHQIKQLIITMPGADTATIKKAVELGRQAGIYKIKIVPSLTEVMRGEASLKNLKDVDVEDLLGRSAIDLDKKQIESFIKGKTVLITGAAGSIGSELSRQVAKFKPSLLAVLDQDETGIFNVLRELGQEAPGIPIKHFVADIQDEEKINAVFSELKPHILFHAAAYKHVPLMEDHPDQAVKNNILGTENLARASVASSVEKFIFISTDKAVNPTSVMGATKRVCEMVCQAYNQKNVTKFISVRFGNVLNSRGSVIPIFKEQIRRRQPLTVTHPDMQRYFMLTSEACLLVMQAGALGKGGEVFVLDMGSPVKIVDLATEMIKLSGLKPDKDIAIVFTGLRPGEKLFEEILTAEEGTAATQNQKIFMARLAKVDFADMQKHTAVFKSLLYQKDKTQIVSHLKKITPYYN